MSLLRISDLSVSISGAPVLRDVALDVAPGQVVGVIGESGSGKSMMALSVMQLLPEHAEMSGQVVFDGQEIGSLTERQLCGLRGRVMSMVFQEPMSALNPLHTIGDQVAEVIRQHEKAPRSEAMRRAGQVLNRVELDVPLSRFPHELSGGQRQRVCIAMAIALRPRLLIADEPTTALDVTTQAEILDLLKRLVAEDGMGLMLISHDLGVVARMADHIAIMKAGQIVEQGQIGGLQHPYSTALLRASGHVPDRSTQAGDQPLLQVREVVREHEMRRRHLWRLPDTFRAVDRVSFEMMRGESLGLVGESGCGKSTLMRAILGLEPLQGGDILLDGRPIDRGIRHRMQAVFQDPYGSFNPRHRVARLVSEPCHVLDNPPTGIALEDAIVEVLESVGLQASDRHKYIHEFSGGQRQRIAIARALIIRPELIILDEAVSALDVHVRAQILDLLADLSDRFGLTYLFISHDLSVVRNVTDRLLVMHAGKIVEEGATADVFANPQHAYTRALIDAVPRLPDEVA